MRILFDASLAAHRNGKAAKLREATRIAMMAWCAHADGHDVVLKPNAMLREHARWEFFAHLDRIHADKPDATVVTPEWWSDHAKARNISRKQLRGIHGKVAAVKTSEDLGDDLWRLELFDVLAGEEYTPETAAHPRFLPQMYFIHDTLIQSFWEHGFLEAYLRNNLRAIRGVPTGWGIDFVWIGASLYGRREIVDRIAGELTRRKNADNLAIVKNIRFTDIDNEAMRVSALQHFAFFRDAKISLHLAGNTPKANRLAEIILAGSVVAAYPGPMPERPAVDRDCSIVLGDDPGGEIAVALDDAVLRTLRVEADRRYIGWWSPMGQTRNLIGMIERA